MHTHTHMHTHSIVSWGLLSASKLANWGERPLLWCVVLDSDRSQAGKGDRATLFPTAKGRLCATHTHTHKHTHTSLGTFYRHPSWQTANCAQMWVGGPLLQPAELCPDSPQAGRGASRDSNRVTHSRQPSLPSLPAEASSLDQWLPHVAHLHSFSEGFLTSLSRTHTHTPEKVN